MVVYVLERFLARLEVSGYSDRFVLKGGMLLAAWDARRATVDADFLVRNLNLDEDAVLRRVVEIAALPAPVEDGVEFRPDTVTASSIRDGDLYGGFRIAMDATVAGAVVKLRLDISTGDPVAPPPTVVDYPTLLNEHPNLSILGYPLPVVLAEKLCTAVELGAGNTRVRDYADIWTLTRSHDITAADLLIALAATSEHRDVALRPLTEVIGDYGRIRAGAYTAYRRRLGPDAAKLPETFARVVDDVMAFADPALASHVASRAVWASRSARWNG
jgi:Nucleotidyl transferase AbiEii toxin, Type IV TA system